MDDQNLRKNIETSGWGQVFLSFRQPDGHWGQRFYQPKWISTHYTLLDLRHLNLPAIEVLLSKRNKQGTWNVNAHYPGEVHLEMEKAGKPSRWNTLRALRVLKFYKVHLD